MREEVKERIIRRIFMMYIDIVVISVLSLIVSVVTLFMVLNLRSSLKEKEDVVELIKEEPKSTVSTPVDYKANYDDENNKNSLRITFEKGVVFNQPEMPDHVVYITLTDIKKVYTDKDTLCIDTVYGSRYVLDNNEAHWGKEDHIENVYYLYHTTLDFIDISENLSSKIRSIEVFYDSENRAPEELARDGYYSDLPDIHIDPTRLYGLLIVDPEDLIALRTDQNEAKVKTEDRDYNFYYNYEAKRFEMTMVPVGYRYEQDGPEMNRYYGDLNYRVFEDFDISFRYR